MRNRVSVELESRLRESRVIQVRNLRGREAACIGAVTGVNEEQLGARETYLVDEEGWLLDAEGQYLVEEREGAKKRIRVEENWLYLLQLQGI